MKSSNWVYSAPGRHSQYGFVLVMVLWLLVLLSLMAMHLP